jgi:hypothetical protein
MIVPFGRKPKIRMAVALGLGAWRTVTRDA